MEYTREKIDDVPKMGNTSGNTRMKWRKKNNRSKSNRNGSKQKK